MNNTIIAFFRQDGAPKTGLTPTIRIRKLSDGSLVVTDGSMTEVGDGWYKYVFAGYVIGTEYAIRCDGGSSLSDTDRYICGSNSGETDTTRKILMNRLELRDGSSGNWVLYDDDDSTAMLTFNVTGKNSEAVSIPLNTPAKRSRGQ